MSNSYMMPRGVAGSVLTACTPAPDSPRQAPGCRVVGEVRVRSEMGP
jgi:hypothetical protein